jgi:hypothetical protein
VFEVNEVEVLQVKRLYSVCLKEMEMFIDPSQNNGQHVPLKIT